MKCRITAENQNKALGKPFPGFIRRNPGNNLFSNIFSFGYCLSLFNMIDNCRL